MKASDIIATSKEAQEIARKYGGKNWQDIYQQSWLSLREQELNGRKINKPLSYFFFIVRNNSNKKKTVRDVPLESVRNLAEELESVSKFDQYQKVCSNFISKKLESEEETYYQQFCELLMYTGFDYFNFRKYVEMPQRTFYRHVGELKKILKNELEESEPI